jgi:hypothetical protein
MNFVSRHNALSDIDPRLLEEAFHRARCAEINRTVDSSSLLSAILAEARRGTRHMHGLVSAAGQIIRAAA